jgi:hypothetical protein
MEDLLIARGFVVAALASTDVVAAGRKWDVVQTVSGA